jgi:hypothetical protein
MTPVRVCVCCSIGVAAGAIDVGVSTAHSTLATHAAAVGAAYAAYTAKACDAAISPDADTARAGLADRESTVVAGKAWDAASSPDAADTARAAETTTDAAAAAGPARDVVAYA